MWLRGSMKISKRKGPKTFIWLISATFSDKSSLRHYHNNSTSPLSGNSWREFCIIKADQAGTDFKYVNLRVLSQFQRDSRWSRGSQELYIYNSPLLCRIPDDIIKMCQLSTSHQACTLAFWMRTEGDNSPARLPHKISARKSIKMSLCSTETMSILHLLKIHI